MVRVASTSRIAPHAACSKVLLTICVWCVLDDAVAAIADRDPMTDGGVFNASAITARQMTAASLLSSDYLAIERRLDRIRTVVQLTLRPAPAPPQKIPAEIEPEIAPAEL